MKKLLCLILVLGAFGCDDSGVCGDGVLVRGAIPHCVYNELIIDGFECPAEYPIQQRGPNGTMACSEVPLGGGFEVVEPGLHNNATNSSNNSNNHNFNNEPFIPQPRPKNDKLDMLFVIDNSGSMCQEQETLVTKIDQMLEQLDGMDFQVGIATTQVNEFSLEPIARPGHIQSEIQPIPGFDRTCHHRVTEDGDIDELDFTPLVTAINFAVDCMAEPDDSFRNPSELDTRCATTRVQSECNSLGCEPGTCGAIESLFPPRESLKQLPKVLKSKDYTFRGEVDMESLKADFKCMAYAGTRGYGFEKGLSSAVLAVSPQMIGGTVENPTNPNAPNHGLLREDSRLGLVFVADEDDCSHGGAINENSSCGDAVCQYQSDELTPITTLRNQFVSNVREARPDLKLEDISVATLTPGAYRGPAPVPQESCEGVDTGIRANCRGPIGVAFSADRYIAFADQFRYSYRLSDDEDANYCGESFSTPLAEIGKLFRE